MNSTCDLEWPSRSLQPSQTILNAFSHKISPIRDWRSTRPWPRIGSHCIPSCITRRPLPTYQISLKSKKLFVDGRTGGHLRPTNVIRSTRRSQPNKWKVHDHYRWRAICLYFVLHCTPNKLKLMTDRQVSGAGFRWPAIDTGNRSMCHGPWVLILGEACCR